MRTLFAVFFLGASLCAAAEPSPRLLAETGRRKPLQLNDYDSTVPQFVDGDSWQSTIVLTNVVPATVYFQIFFSNDNGDEQTFDIAGLGQVSSITGQLAIGQSVEFRTAGSAPALTQGYASLYSFDRPANQTGARLTEARIGGYAIFKRKIAGLPDQEAVVPVANPLERQFFIPFDNRDGFQTGVALVNDTNQSGTLSVIVRDRDGLILASEALPMAAGTKQVYLVKDRFPASADKAGAIQYSISSIGLCGLGLRFNPTGSFTSTHPLSYVF